MNDFPSLAEQEDKRVTCATWFEQRPRVAQELAKYMDTKGVESTHRYLQRNFQFPFESERLRRYAIKMGWHQIKK